MEVQKRFGIVEAQKGFGECRSRRGLESGGPEGVWRVEVQKGLGE